MTAAAYPGQTPRPVPRGRARSVGPQQLDRQPKVTDTESFVWDKRWPGMSDSVTVDAVSKHLGKATSRGSASVRSINPAELTVVAALRPVSDA
ncbi:MAG: hypothetical protein ACRDQZ_13280, partial [Mycobacteriales bacterium]